MINSLGPLSEGYEVLWYVEILQNERFFCCTSCKTEYSEKYNERIESIKRRHEG